MKQSELVVTTRIDKAKDSPELKNVLDTQLAKIYQEKVESEKLNITRTKEILKARYYLRDGIFSSTSKLCRRYYRRFGSRCYWRRSGANVIGEGDANLVRMERKKDKINQINSLKHQ
ncbi:hypothetical protein FEC77_05170 [Rickettsia parkeri]|uniref:hypothetical protein n=1 Tax=Rickettsia parkeri TaxID=35792 RepID=UPI0010FBC806|nr:hypothetical protein [Rickettsia parkeri]QCS24508.1 hypothetical protein FEC77_05170 [Rickettsia parkeri]QWB86896.1 hypothetical protein JRD95_00957 [Rickettsia parkeri]